MKLFQRFATIFWYGFALYLVLLYTQGPLARTWAEAHNFSTWVSFGRSVLGVVLVVAFFVLVHLLARAASVAPPLPPVPPPASGKGESFPAEITVTVGIWLIVLSALLVLGLFLALNIPYWPDWMRLKAVLAQSPDFSNALVTMFAAGVGSLITTILGYLQHATDDKDFDRAHAPWYVARPAMGSLLGLIFYFVIRGGLVATVPKFADGRELNVWTLAGFGSLVGMFSKSAIDKLKEIFDTIFSTKEEPNEANTSQAGKSDTPKPADS